MACSLLMKRQRFGLEKFATFTTQFPIWKAAVRMDMKKPLPESWRSQRAATERKTNECSDYSRTEHQFKIPVGYRCHPIRRIRALAVHNLPVAGNRCRQ